MGIHHCGLVAWRRPRPPICRRSGLRCMRRGVGPCADERKLVPPGGSRVRPCSFGETASHGADGAAPSRICRCRQHAIAHAPEGRELARFSQLLTGGERTLFRPRNPRMAPRYRERLEGATVLDRAGHLVSMAVRMLRAREAGSRPRAGHVCRGHVGAGRFPSRFHSRRGMLPSSVRPRDSGATVDNRHSGRYNAVNL